MRNQGKPITLNPEQLDEFVRAKSMLWQAQGMAEIIATHKDIEDVNIITLQTAVKGIHALLLDGLMLIEEV